MLKRCRIVEFEGLGPAPFAGMMLADLGAEVIVVHRKGGPVTPGMPERNLLDRGKRSIELDLKSDTDTATALALIKTADGLIEGLRPGVMERLGLGPDPAMKANPALVYGRMTGWGQTGPKAAGAGHDLNYLGLSGALFYAGRPGQVPAVPPTMLGDIGGGALYLVIGMLAGLIRARETGQGTVVDAAIVDGASHMMALLLSMQDQFSTNARGASLLDGPHWSRVYRCADGQHLAVQCLEPKFYGLFLRKLGLYADPDFQAQFDKTRWERLSRRLETLFASQPRTHWVRLFEGSDACVAPVLSPDDARNDPHIRERRIWEPFGASMQPAPAPRFDGHRRAPKPVGARGADAKDILSELKDRGLI